MNITNVFSLLSNLSKFLHAAENFACSVSFVNKKIITPDKAAYCVFTQFRGPENAIKFISVRTKTQ